MTTERVASEIRGEMAKRRITQDLLAERIGHSQKWVSRRLQGDVEFKLSELQDIAAALDIPVSQLLADEPV